MNSGFLASLGAGFLMLVLNSSSANAAAERPASSRLERDGVLVIATGEPRRQWFGTPISLSLKNADLAEVLRSLARLTKLNLILDPRIEGKVTVELVNVPWDQALHVILKTHRLAMEVDGSIVSIAPLSRPRPSSSR